MAEIVVCALYKFVTLDDFQARKQPLLDFMLGRNIRGTLLLAREGVNGTVAGTREAIAALLAYLREDPRLADIDFKTACTDTLPFQRSRVRLKKEIVTMGVEGIDPRRVAGTYVKPKEWNQLIADPDVLLIDTRNDYEIKVGTFKEALNPQTGSFREFPDYVKTYLDPDKHKKVAIFCTGGIRCEKAAAYLKGRGFDEVYHLEGGILKYLEEVPHEDSIWEGECFVFDDRVTVNHRLEKGEYDQCHACRLPITDEDKHSPLYQKGISCPHCHDQTTAEQKRRFAEREQQIQLARRRGETHLGQETTASARLDRLHKQQRREADRMASHQK